MPKCKNNQNVIYRGTEYSPHGLGYCAFSEETGTLMKGRDNQTWIVINDLINGKRWVPFIQKASELTKRVDPTSESQPLKKIKTEE